MEAPTVLLKYFDLPASSLHMKFLFLLLLAMTPTPTPTGSGKYLTADGKWPPDPTPSPTGKFLKADGPPMWAECKDIPECKKQLDKAYKQGWIDAVKYMMQSVNLYDLISPPKNS